MATAATLQRGLWRAPDGLVRLEGLPARPPYVSKWQVTFAMVTRARHAGTAAAAGTRSCRQIHPSSRHIPTPIALSRNSPARKPPVASRSAPQAYGVTNAPTWARVLIAAPPTASSRADMTSAQADETSIGMVKHAVAKIR